MRVLRSSWLVLLAIVIVVGLYRFRPGGVEGPRVEPVPAEGMSFSHQSLSAVLSAVVAEDGTVDYAALRKDRAPLDRYLGELRATSPASAPHRFKTSDDRLAYYINAYNAFVLAGVRDHCPVERVGDLYWYDGFYWRISFLMGEEEVTLNALKDGLIREVQHGDAALHFVLQPGARGRPPLERAAFDGADVRERLKAATQRVLHDARYVRRKGDVLEVIDLFKWYQADFGGDAKAWIRVRAPELITDAVRLEFVPMDPTLNGGC